jgi:hypothetical protein
MSHRALPTGEPSPRAGGTMVALRPWIVYFLVRTNALRHPVFLIKARD